MSSEEDLPPPMCSQNHQQAEAEADGGRLGKLLTELESTKEKLVYKKLELERARQQIEELKHAKQECFRVKRELELAKEELKKLQKKVGVHFSVERFKHSCDDMRFYMVLPSYAEFQSLLKFMNPGDKGENGKVLPLGLRTDTSYAGDVVMAYKGFKIQDMLSDINVGLNMPPFLTRGQFSEDEVRETEDIASLRIHVERRIQRIKNFHIFDRPIPLSLGPIINEVWVVCALLTNFQSPIVRPLDE
ncbi:hypothetical protein MTO96_005157 [Rhipicephalus appendiculatus]